VDEDLGSAKVVGESRTEHCAAQRNRCINAGIEVKTQIDTRNALRLVVLVEGANESPKERGVLKRDSVVGHGCWCGKETVRCNL